MVGGGGNAIIRDFVLLLDKMQQRGAHVLSNAPALKTASRRRQYTYIVLIVYATTRVHNKRTNKTRVRQMVIKSGPRSRSLYVHAYILLLRRMHMHDCSECTRGGFPVHNGHRETRLSGEGNYYYHYAVITVRTYMCV